MPELAVLHSGRAVALVGQDVVASVLNNGQEEVFVGLSDVSSENFEVQLSPGDRAVLKGPLFALSVAPCPVIVEDDPDALRAAAKPKKAPEKKTPEPKPASKKKRNA